MEDRTIKFNIDENDPISNILFLTIADSIGVLHGLEENEVISLLNSIDIDSTIIDGINFVTNENNIEASINIDKKIDTSSLKTMYFEVKDYKEYEEFIKNSGFVQTTKGNLIFYKTGNDLESTIIIGEKDNLTDITYKSILSLIELLYPDELETFKTSYPELTTISFDKYVITIDPTNNKIIDETLVSYKNDYKFIEIKINKGA